MKKLNIGKTNESKMFGMAYELIKDCALDIDAAIAFLQKEGFKEFYLVGESTGANKICVYDFYKPENEISKYILLGGGDDTGIYYDQLGDKKFWPLLEQALQHIKKDTADEIVPDLLPDDIFSYKSFYDLANPDGDYNVFPFYEALKDARLSRKQVLFHKFKALHKPSLVIYGEKDEYAWGNVPKIVNILKKVQPDFTYKIVKGADHSFHGHRDKVGKLIADWL